MIYPKMLKRKFRKKEEPERILFRTLGPYHRAPEKKISHRDGQIEGNAPRAFSYTGETQRDNQHKALAECLNAENNQTKVYCLEEMVLSDRDFHDLSRQSKSKYLPYDSQWVRLCSDDDKSHLWFLPRKDIQSVASALLGLPLTRNGYMFPSTLISSVLITLFQASHYLHPLLTRLLPNIDRIVLNREKGANLANAMESLIPLTRRKFRHLRLTSQALFDVGKALEDIFIESDIRDSVGVLMLTCEEFRDLIMASSRHIRDSLNNSIVLDHSPGSLKVSSALGFVEEFPVELDAINPHRERKSEASEIKLGFVMLAALNAVLRSFSLRTAISPIHLMEMVSQMSPVVYMG